MPFEPIGDYESPVGKSKPYVFTFGKHDGESIEDVPNTYLDWLQKDLAPEEWEYVLDKVEEEQTRRHKKGIYIEDEYEESRRERFSRRYY